MKSLTFTLKKGGILLLSLFILLNIPNKTHAEGTSAIAPSQADEVALLIGAGNTGFSGGDYGLFAWKDSDSKLHFNIQNTCEKVYLGFSIPKGNRQFTQNRSGLIFRILTPNGQPINNLSCFGNTTINGEVWQTLGAADANISTRSQADNGPNQLGNTGGYSAFELDLSQCGLTATGNYIVEFYTTDSSYDPNTQGAGYYVEYFDITVADCTSTGLTGRVWSNNWGFGIKNDGDGPFDRAFNGSLYVCSLEGFITKIDFNSGINTRAEANKATDQKSGFRAGSFNVAFNTYGAQNTGNILTDRQSIPDANTTAAELPIFLNEPDEALCQEVNLGQFLSAAPFITGCPDDRCINVLASEPGQLDILIEGLGGNGSYDDPSERQLAYSITAADLAANPQNPDYPYEACVPWDGRDGNGNLISGADFTISGFYSQGIYHFPVYDAEFNDDGYIIETIRPALGQQVLFYDDTQITEPNNTGESKNGTNGCVGPCHQWTGEWENISDKNEVYGNFNTINTWWFANRLAKNFTSSINSISPISIVCPDDVNGCPATSTDPSVTGMATSPNAAFCPIKIEYSDAVVSGACGAQTITRTWTAYDEGAPEVKATCTQIITLADDLVPLAPAAPADVVGQCAADVPAVVTLSATDNCDGYITVSPVDTKTDGSCPNSFTIVRTWTFVDDCGNTSSVSQNISINDDTAPVAPAAPADVVGQCAADVPAAVALTATDNCDGDISVSPVDTKTDGSCPNSFTIVRTWTFVDDCGNTSSISQNISINDDAALVAPAAPADVVGQCAADVPAAVALTATDNCDGSINANPVDTKTDGSCPNSFTIVRTWTFVDDCGNTSSVSQNISISDDTAPVAPAAPADAVRQCAADVPTAIALTATDNCDGDINANPVDVKTDGSCPNSFTIVRTWTFVDGCGNTSSVSQNISISDDTAPVAPAAPVDVVGQCAADVPAPVNLTATDNCDGDISVSPVDTKTDGSCPNSFTIVRNWTFVDGCGNTSSVSQNISISDDTAPVAPAAPADVVGQCAADVPAAVALTATDNCDGSINANPVDTKTDDSCPNSFTIVRTWTFVDDCGNTRSVSQNISINDDTAPVVPNPPADVTSCLEEVPEPVSLTATDNCDGTITVNPVDVKIEETNTIIRTWTFIDDCGNESSVSQNILMCEPRVIADRYCTFTQGFWGNKNGKFEGRKTSQILDDILSQGSITIGQLGSRSLTITSTKCVLALLPGGGPSSILSNGNVTTGNSCDPGVVPTKRNGRIHNVLAAQMIALTLNTRLDGNLSALPLANLCFNVNSSILNALPSNPTIEDLLAYANAVIAGNASANLSTLNDVISRINESFGGCSKPCNTNGFNPSRITPFISDAVPATTVKELPSLSIAPNPANRNTSINLDNFQGHTVQLVLLNKMGQVVFDRSVEVNDNHFTERIPLQQLASGLYYLMAQSQQDGQLYTKKLMVQ